MRIVHVTENLVPPSNGIATSVLSLITAQAAMDHDVVLVSSALEGSRPRDHPMTVDVTASRTVAGYPLTFRGGTALGAAIQSHRPDIVHVHSPGLLGQTASRICRRRQIPAVTTWHTDVLAYRDAYPEIDTWLPLAFLWGARPSEFARWLVPAVRTVTRSTRRNDARIALERLTIAYLERFHGVIAPSDKTKSYLIALGLDPARIWVVPTSPNRPSEGLYKGFHQSTSSQQNNTVIIVGRTSGEKNIELLFSAMQEYVLPQIPTARLVVVGRGREHARYVALARPLGQNVTLVSGLGLHAFVRFTGVVERADLDRIYRDADLLVFPSLTDTQGLVWLEAAILGLPTLYLDPAISTLPASEPALTVERASPEALAERLTLLSQRREFLRSVGMQLPELAKGILADVSNRWCDLVATLVAPHRESPT